MRTFARVAFAVAGLVLAGPALAGEQTLVLRSPEITVPGYGVSQGTLLVPSPAEDGYVTGLTVDIVDAAGNVQGPGRIMLHHVVLARFPGRDFTCGSSAERFFALGEERFALRLPAGYGYANNGSDGWGMVYMLMNHRQNELRGYVRYTVRYTTGETLAPVTPVWLDVRNCSGPDPVFDVPGTGKPGSTYTTASDFTMPRSGRLVAGGGHVHGGAARLELRNTTCGTTPFTSEPTWGGPEPKPLLHEPGPAKMSSFTSAEGIPVAAGQKLRLAAVYDNGAPHARAMGIMILYLAPGEVSGCPAAPALAIDRGSPSPPPPFTLPLPRAPKGPVAKDIASTWVGDYRYGKERISIKRGTTFSWQFVGGVRHDVTVVSGPEGFSAPWSASGGSFSHRFTRPGTYKLFCSLHPAQMVQQILVR
jgi:plastocyanin